MIVVALYSQHSSRGTLVLHMKTVLPYAQVIQRSAMPLHLSLRTRALSSKPSQLRWLMGLLPAFPVLLMMLVVSLVLRHTCPLRIRAHSIQMEPATCTTIPGKLFVHVCSAATASLTKDLLTSPNCRSTRPRPCPISCCILSMLPAWTFYQFHLSACAVMSLRVGSGSCISHSI